MYHYYSTAGGGEPNKTKVKFDMVIAWLVIGKKYQISKLQQEAMCTLQYEYSSTLPDIDTVDHNKLIEQRALHLEVLELMQIAQKDHLIDDLRNVLPWAYFAASHYLLPTDNERKAENSEKRPRRTC